MDNYYVLVTCPICDDQIETNNEDAIVQIVTCGCVNCLDGLKMPTDTRIQTSGLESEIS